MISVIIPAYNEEGNVKRVHQEILDALGRETVPFEIIFVDDGSTDATLKELKGIKNIKIIVLRRNFGQTAAVDAGINASQGNIIITIDADGQNDPSDIPKLLKKIAEGFDVVSGWRIKRKDPLSKIFISRGANLLRKIFIKDGLHDSGCALKAYKRECFENFNLYGEIHRFIPGILKAKGYSVCEVAVNHRPRVNGKSKYGLSRTLKGFLDMLGIWFWDKYSARPLHLFGGIGLFLSFSGTVLVSCLFVLRLFSVISLKNSIWPLAGFFLILVGMQLFVSGILADIAIKNYYRSHSLKPYSIKEIRK